MPRMNVCISVCHHPPPLLASGQSGSKNIFVFYGALRLKASFYGFVGASKRRNILRVSREHVTSSISIKGRSHHECCHIIWDHIWCITSCSGVMRSLDGKWDWLDVVSFHLVQGLTLFRWNCQSHVLAELFEAFGAWIHVTFKYEVTENYPSSN